jgi:glycosyltransferase involved in cell wall biosynthesis
MVSVVKPSEEQQPALSAPPAIAPDVARATGLEPASVLILTKNEELNIRDCLETLGFSDDIVVLDSLSNDRTLEIARRFPHVRTVQRPFDIEWKQRNYGLHDIEFKHPWVYICDADERVPKDLAEEIVRVVNDPACAHVAYRLRYKNMYLGRWIKHASSYPVWIMRLVRPKRVTYEVRETNVHPIVDGTVGELRGHFIHYSFSAGLKRWFQKHNFYSTREAMEGVKIRRAGRPKLAALRSADPMVRRRALKNLSYFVSGRALLRFMLSYVLGGGFLDGIAGLHYCLMIATYEYWIELKINEQESDWRGQTNRLVEKLLDEKDPRGTGGQPVISTLDSHLVEVMIPTLNESDHIADTVKNALKLGPVFVLDSLSTDGTHELARQAGATVVEHEFIDYATQKNWGLDHLPFKGQWVFILDADERITPQLREEVLRKIQGSRPADGYYINRSLLFMGKSVQHGGLYPSWNLRLFRRGKARYEARSVHEHVVCSGSTDYMRNEMVHIRRESINQYLEKHIRYADLESNEWLKWRLGKSRSADTAALFKDALRIRQWVRRNLWPRLPGRPLWRFLWMYVFRFGFLDGKAGWHLAELMACYEYMISLLYKDKINAAHEAARKSQNPS